MYIPQLNFRQTPKWVQDKVDVSDCVNLEQLTTGYNKAIELNEIGEKNFTPAFEITTEEYPYDDYTYPKAYFCYYRKPSEDEVESVRSYNYRMIENYNKFIKENPKVAEALGMKIQKHENTLSKN